MVNGNTNQVPLHEGIRIIRSGVPLNIWFRDDGFLAHIGVEDVHLALRKQMDANEGFVQRCEKVRPFAVYGGDYPPGNFGYQPLSAGFYTVTVTCGCRNTGLSDSHLSAVVHFDVVDCPDPTIGRLPKMPSISQAKGALSHHRDRSGDDTNASPLFMLFKLYLAFFVVAY